MTLHKTSETEAIRLLEQLENERYAALLQRDVATLKTLLADDLIYIHSSAVSHNKTEYLAAFERGDFLYEDFNREGVEIRQLSPGSALISGFITIKVKVDGENKTLRNLFINTWRQTQRGWEMVSWQSTAMPARND